MQAVGLQLYKKEIPLQLFPYEFHEIWNNTFDNWFLRASIASFTFKRGHAPKSHITQKQPLEVFYENRCSEKFRKFHRKTLALETTRQMFFLQTLQILKNTYFEEHLRTPASNHRNGKFETILSFWQFWFCYNILSKLCSFHNHICFLKINKNYL